MHGPVAGGDVYFVNTTESRGTKVTSERVTLYTRSLQGGVELDGRITVQSFQKRYMSLCKVWFDKDFVLEPETSKGLRRCLCKDFMHSVVCPHVLAVKASRKEMDLDGMVQDLPKRKKV